MRVFADSFYFIAFLDSADAYHQAAITYPRNRRVSIVTTRWVLAEVANALSSPPLRQRVGEFIAQIQHQPAVTVYGNSDELFAEGLALYRSRLDKAWSLTDCISFTVMERERLNEALTGDKHFEQAGFVKLF